MLLAVVFAVVLPASEAGAQMRLGVSYQANTEKPTHGLGVRVEANTFRLVSQVRLAVAFNASYSQGRQYLERRVVGEPKPYYRYILSHTPRLGASLVARWSVAPRIDLYGGTGGGGVIYIIENPEEVVGIFRSKRNWFASAYVGASNHVIGPLHVFLEGRLVQMGPFEYKVLASRKPARTQGRVAAGLSLEF